MEKKFTSEEIPLDQMLKDAGTGELQLPDFQRGWVWDDNHIASLLASISLSYPIGAVMTLQTGNPDVRFRPRPIEGVALDGVVEPEVLMLDGQQRMTSLYLALKSGQPVRTRDSKGKDLERLYFADIRGCLDTFTDREDAIYGVPGNGIVKTFRGEVTLDVSTRPFQIAAEVFPLGIILDPAETMDWSLDYLSNGPGEPADRLNTWKRFNAAVINAFVQYQVPTITLVRSTPKEAVCQVFEKVNTGGVSLTVFELLTATYAADDYNLRDKWDEIERQLEEQAILGRFEATDFLQVVTLLATRHRRADFLAASPDEERAPAITCKRKDILRLELADFEKWADEATHAIGRVVPFLHGEHIFTARDLPYATQLVPLAAIFAVLGDKAEGHGARQKLRQWYWSGVFGEMYGGSTESRFALDLQDVVAWIEGAGSEPLQGPLRPSNEARSPRLPYWQPDRYSCLRRRRYRHPSHLPEEVVRQKRNRREHRRFGREQDSHRCKDEQAHRRRCADQVLDEDRGARGDRVERARRHPPVTRHRRHLTPSG
jgi:hypothetical protein